MKKSVHKQVINAINKEEWDFENVLEILVRKFTDEKRETLRSILNQEYLKNIKRHHKYQTSEDKKREIVSVYHSAVRSKDYRQASAGVIIDIAKRNRFSPAITAKIIVEDYLKTDQGEVSKEKLSQLTKNSALIEDQTLATEVWLANLKDSHYGVSSESIKTAVGYDYEKKAKRALEEIGLSYRDEHELRAKGYDKTPDIKLDIPFAYNGHVINWIESKALFGDEENHKDYLNQQLWSYWNRYGSGMVIYWFGFIEELDNNRDKGIIVCDNIPTDIEIFNPQYESSTDDED